MTSAPALSRPVLSALCAALDAECAGGGTVSVWLGGADGCAWFERDAHLPHYAASTMKLPLAIAVQQLITAGQLDAATPIEVHNDFCSAYDRSVFHLDETDDQDPPTWEALGATRTVAQLLEHCVTHSGNLATNLLLDLVGTSRVADVLHACGCSPTTVVARGIEDARAREHGISNLVTAADLGAVMAGVARDAAELGGPAVTGPVRSILARQLHRDQIPAGLPEGTWTASKSGWVTGLSHDVAIVRPASSRWLREYVLAVCTTIDRSETEGAALVAAVSRGVWQALDP